MEAKLYQALIAHYSSELQKSQANLVVCFKNPTITGGSVDVVQEMIKHVNNITAAQGAIQVLNDFARSVEETATADTADTPDVPTSEE